MTLAAALTQAGSPILDGWQWRRGIGNRAAQGPIASALAWARAGERRHLAGAARCVGARRTSEAPRSR